MLKQKKKKDKREREKEDEIKIRRNRENNKQRTHIKHSKAAKCRLPEKALHHIG